MAALTDDQRSVLENLFKMNDFRSMYVLIDSIYRELNFSDKLTDEERIAEYKYVTQQLRKYISQRQDPFFKCGSNLDAMSSLVGEWLAKANEYGETRKDLAYNFLRDSWILEVWNGVEYVKTMYDEEEEVG